MAGRERQQRLEAEQRRGELEQVSRQLDSLKKEVAQYQTRIQTANTTLRSCNKVSKRSIQSNILHKTQIKLIIFQFAGEVDKGAGTRARAGAAHHSLPGLRPLLPAQPRGGRPHVEPGDTANSKVAPRTALLCTAGARLPVPQPQSAQAGRGSGHPGAGPAGWRPLPGIAFLLSSFEVMLVYCS